MPRSEMYLRTHLASEQRTNDLEALPRRLRQRAHRGRRIRLRKLQAPTLIVWGTDDVYFDVKWSHWLAETIPGTRRRVEFAGARFFFPEERWGGASTTNCARTGRRVWPVTAQIQKQLPHFQ